MTASFLLQGFALLIVFRFGLHFFRDFALFNENQANKSKNLIKTSARPIGYVCREIKHFESGLLGRNEKRNTTFAVS
jgi:hypothetical protein